MRLEWFEEAKFEFADAARHYFWEQPGIEENFIGEVDRAVAKILDNPEMHREFDPPFRKLKTDRFPFQIVYVVEEQSIVVVAVMHQSRKPGYWKKRLK